MADITPFDRNTAGRMDSEDVYAPGQWYWVKGQRWVDNEYVPTSWLGCIQKIGSNYIEIASPWFDNSRSQQRIHLDEAAETLTFEPDADAAIATKVAESRQRLDNLLGAVRETMGKLGVVPTGTSLAHMTSAVDNALAVMSTQVDTAAYKTALIEAKDKTLPDLFKQIKKATYRLKGWLSAPILPLEATMVPMKEVISGITDRIDTLALYAGLAEEAVKVRDGDPAMTGEKLRVMQRRLYMDEESLANIEDGGLDIKTLDQFDTWLAVRENFERILPFPRCLVAFRVRRDQKEREDYGNVGEMLANINIAQADKSTFLYVRNGDQIWRIDCDFTFDEKLVPDRAEFDPSQPQMAEMFAGRVRKFIPLSRFEQMQAENAEWRRKREEWDAANPDIKEKWMRNPYSHSEPHWSMNDYEAFDRSSVYYDEMLAFMEAEIKRYNRVAVIIQGLFDRSLVLHPHNPVHVWEPESFARAIELVYDATTLTGGEAPDFEAYRQELNAQITGDSVLTGQEDFWLRKMAAKENAREEADYRNRSRTRSNYIRYRPYGDPGPGFVQVPTSIQPRARRAVFNWTAEKTQMYGYEPGTKPRSITVPFDSLLNVSAYKPGDYKRFLSDSRTRRDYLRWAPLLLAAEEYHAGRARLGEARAQTNRRY